MVTISGKALGRKKPLFADWSVDLPPGWQGEESPTLREVIVSVVRAEVQQFKQRQHDRRFLQVLTSRQMEEAAEMGKITMGGAELKPQDVNEDEAVTAALEAFADGIYLVVVDGRQCKSLDAQVFLRVDSQLTFIRLTLLAGG